MYWDPEFSHFWPIFRKSSLRWFYITFADLEQSHQGICFGNAEGVCQRLMMAMRVAKLIFTLRLLSPFDLPWPIRSPQATLASSRRAQGLCFSFCWRQIMYHNNFNGLPFLISVYERTRKAWKWVTCLGRGTLMNEKSYSEILTIDIDIQGLQE